MSKVTIAGDVNGTGVFTIAAPNGNTNRTLTLPDEAGTVLTTAGVPASAMPAGSVIQVVSAFKNNTFSAAAGSHVDITGLAASITPLNASNKIFIIVSIGALGVNANGAFTARLLRGTTEIAQPDVGSSDPRDGFFNFYHANATGITVGASIHFLDFPATTSSTTYKVSGYCNAGTFYINRLAGDSDWQSTSSITLMEIAA
jgi:hypothetical protein